VDILVRDTHAWKSSRVHIRPVVYVLFTEHVRDETISYARTTCEVGASERFSPAQYYAGIDNAELVNAFPDQCAPFIDHTRKDLARTSTITYLRSSHNPLCAPRPKFVVVAVRRMRWLIRSKVGEVEDGVFRSREFSRRNIIAYPNGKEGGNGGSQKLDAIVKGTRDTWIGNAFETERAPHRAPVALLTSHLYCWSRQERSFNFHQRYENF